MLATPPFIYVIHKLYINTWLMHSKHFWINKIHFFPSLFLWFIPCSTFVPISFIFKLLRMFCWYSVNRIGVWLTNKTMRWYVLNKNWNLYNKHWSILFIGDLSISNGFWCLYTDCLQLHTRYVIYIYITFVLQKSVSYRNGRYKAINTYLFFKDATP